jgi:cytochrome c oxidase subunit II
MLYSLPLDATPPTVHIFTTLQNYYLFFGTAAGLVVGAYMVYQIAKNRERPGRQTPAFHHEEGDWGNWKSVVLLLCVTGSVLAFVEYQTFASANLVAIPDPPNTLNVGVVGRQFSWSFTYPNGYTDFQNLTVPLDQIVVLNITSADVTHGLYIPELDVAKDAQPGIYNQLWFNATQPGVFTIECRQLCGTGHALMLSKLVVESSALYNAWYAKLPAAPTAKGGA